MKDLVTIKEAEDFLREKKEKELVKDFYGKVFGFVVLILLASLITYFVHWVNS